MNPGFEVHPAVFPPSACTALLDVLPSSGRRAGRRHLLGHPAVADLADSGPLRDLARRHVGAGAAPFRATLFEKTGERSWLVAWHQDTALPLREKADSPGWGPWSIKEGILFGHAPAWALERVVALRVHLDDSTADNGPLRVLPGSHRHGVLSAEEILRRAKTEPAVDVPVARGGVLVLRPLLIHASSKAATPAPRRVLHLEYAACLDLGPGLRLARA